MYSYLFATPFSLSQPHNVRVPESTRGHGTIVANHGQYVLILSHLWERATRTLDWDLRQWWSLCSKMFMVPQLKYLHGPSAQKCSWSLSSKIFMVPLVKNFHGPSAQKCSWSLCLKIFMVPLVKNVHGPSAKKCSRSFCSLKWKCMLYEKQLRFIFWKNQIYHWISINAGTL